MVFTMQDPASVRTNTMPRRRRAQKLEKLDVSPDTVDPHDDDVAAVDDDGGERSPGGTHTPSSLMDLIPDRVRDISGRLIHRAEVLEDSLRALPGHARHKAEELGEELIAFPGYAIHKAEEIGGRAIHTAETIGEELIALPGKAIESAEEIAYKIWDTLHHTHLPHWLKDNEYLISGHRPQLQSFSECFKSIFRIHSETGNIWTHLLGFLAFIVIALWFGVDTPSHMPLSEQIAFYSFFAGAILCLGFSWVFHTVYCHSEHVGKVFCKLDYSGIALLTMGSFVPWCYYSFHTNVQLMVFYIMFINILGSLCIIVSMMDKFAQPKFRAIRAGVFVGLGLSAAVPISHVIIVNGFWESFYFAALGWLFLMAFLYIAGAVVYACRVPERIWPGKFDIWFQSHQIFHVFVIAAAFVHYHGISEIANHRLNGLSFSSFSSA